MQWSVTTPPSGTVLTWEQLKHHLHAPVSQQQLVMDYQASAYAYAETMLEQCILSQTITAVYDERDIAHFIDAWLINLRQCRQSMLLPRGPLLDPIGTSSIVSVTDANSNPVEYTRHTAGNAEYLIPVNPIQMAQCPITVVYHAGYSTVPTDIANAIRIHVGSLYMVRADTSNLAANPVHKIDDYYRYRGRSSMVH